MPAFMARSVVALLIALLTTPVFARRQRLESSSAVASQEVAVGRAAVAGMHLRGRYVLVKFLERRGRGGQADEANHSANADGPGFGGWDGGRGAQQRAPKGTPGRVWPESATGFSNQKHLGQGNFGDVWEARDLKTGRTVAVKIFYSPRTKQFLSWNSANRQERQDFVDNVKECELSLEFQRKRHVYPVGASRICRCFEEHVTKTKGTDKVAFLVMEMCGQSLTNIRKQMASSSNVERNLETARKLTTQVLEALEFFRLLNPTFIHHDLKLDNVVATGSGDSLQVKIIDFGCFVWGTQSNKNTASMGDLRYMPPELSGRNAFDMPASSFDMYGAGLLHAELLCPKFPAGAWFRGRPGGASMRQIRSLIQQYCRHISLTKITDDLTFIEKAIQPSARLRPTPEKAMEIDCFSSEPSAPVELEFIVGTIVLYRSRSLGREVQCTIKGHKGGNYIVECDHGTAEAPPNRIRPLKADARIDPDNNLRSSIVIPEPVRPKAFKIGDFVEYKLAGAVQPWKIVGVEGEKYLIQYKDTDRVLVSPKWLKPYQ